MNKMGGRIRSEWMFNYGERIKMGQNIPELEKEIERIKDLCAKTTWYLPNKFDRISYETIRFIELLRREEIDTLNQGFKEKADDLYHLFYYGNIFRRDDIYWGKQVVELLDELKGVLKTFSRGD